MQSVGSSYLTLPEWVEQVRPHLEKNGEPSPEEDLKTIVTKALIFLNHEGHARQISLDGSTGKWKVFQRFKLNPWFRGEGKMIFVRVLRNLTRPHITYPQPLFP